MKDFRGGLLVVSHDRHMISQVSSSLCWFTRPASSLNVSRTEACSARLASDENTTFFNYTWTHVHNSKVDISHRVRKIPSFDLSENTFFACKAMQSVIANLLFCRTCSFEALRCEYESNIRALEIKVNSRNGSTVRL